MIYNRFKNIIIFTTFAMMLGCNEIQKEMPSTIRKAIMPIDGNLIPMDSITHLDVDGIFKPFGMINVNDDYLVLNQYNSDNLLKVFSLPNLEFLYTWGNRGRGPSEYTDPPMFFNAPGDDKLIISNIFRFVQDTYSITDTTITFITSDELRYTNQTEPLERVRFINDSTYIADYRSHLIEENYEYVLLKTNSPNNFTLFGEYPIKDWQSADQKHFYHLKSNAYNSNRDIFSAFYMYANSMKTFDSSGNMVSHVVYDDFHYSKVNTEASNRDLLRLITHSDQRYIYTVGFYKNSTMVYDENDTASSSYFEVWDWDGNSVYRSRFDRLITYFTVSQKHGRIFGFTSSNLDAVYTYTLPNQIAN